MEEKARDLLDNCVRIVCELPVGDPEIVTEATAGKLMTSGDEPSDEDRDQAKILVPVLQWLLAPAPKKARKKKTPQDTSDEGKKTVPRKKKRPVPKDPPPSDSSPDDPPPDADGDNLTV